MDTELSVLPGDIAVVPNLSRTFSAKSLLSPFRAVA